MTFALPLGLLGLLALPAVVALHLYRRRHQQRRVAGLFLFPQGRDVATAGRKRRPLLLTPSLWLELLVALMAALCLSGLSCDRRARDHVVIVLDDSASMGAHVKDESFRSRAMVAIDKVLNNAHDPQVSLMLTGAPPTLVVGPRAEREQLAGSLGRWKPQQPLHDLGPATARAKDIAGAHGQVVLVTDTPPVPMPPAIGVVAIGSPVANAGLIAAYRLRDAGGQERILVDAGCWSTTVVHSTLTLTALGGGERRVLRKQNLTLAPNNPQHLELTIPPTSRPIEVRLADDALAIDNTITLLPAENRPLTVNVAMAAELSDQLALGKALAAIPDLEIQQEPASLVFAATAGQTATWTSQVIVHVPSEQAKTRSFGGPFIRAAFEPILQDVHLTGAIWTAAEVELPGRPLIERGTFALLSFEQTSSEAGAPERIHINIDPQRTNIVSQADWPIVLANIASWARGRRAGQGPVNVRLGERMVFRNAKPSANTLNLVTPSGEHQPVVDSALIALTPRQPGLHRLQRRGEDIAVYSAYFADANESNLQPCSEAEKAAPVPAEQDPEREQRRLTPMLAMVALLALFADWFVLAPRSRKKVGL